MTGYPYGNDAGKKLGVKAISARVLCESHNSKLSDLDNEGGHFLKAFFSTHVGLLREEFATDQVHEVDGLLIERWLLKYACGLLASGQAAFGTERMQRTSPPLEFLHALFGVETLPDEWGLYTRPTSPIGVSERKGLAFGLYLPLQPTGVRHVCGVKMEHYGFTSIFALATPPEPFIGTDLEGSLHHPEFFKFSYTPTGRSAVITVNWPEQKREEGFTVELHKNLDLPLGRQG